MFGQKSTFGGGGFGSSAFGSTPATNPFGGGATSAFGQQQSAAPAFGTTSTPAFGTTAGSGGLFGAAQPAAGGGGLFGQTPTTNAFGGAGGFGAKPATGFGAGGSAFQAGSTGFGSTGGFGGVQTSTPSTGTSLFGSSTPSSSTGGLFGQPANQPSAFGGFGGGGSAFGQQSNVVGTTVKFNPPTGTDTMMKSGVSQTISTRHQCISCQKEYENKSLEELRCEDYMANRKGAGAGGTTTTGGLFGQAAPNQTAGAGGLFGQTTQQSSIFGAQQQNKPLFGAASTGGFGTSTPQSGFGTSFGATTTNATSGGLFGSKPTAFGAPQTSTTGFAFGGAATTQSTGGMFGQQNQAKPFGSTAPSGGGLFGSTGATGSAFGATATPAFGATTGGFGQPQQNTSIGLFGQQNKPAGFGATGFGAPATSAAPAFGGFGATGATAQPTAFGQQAKPGFGFGAATSQPSAFGGFGATQPQTGGLFGNKPTSLSFGTSTTSSFGTGATGFGTTGGFGATNPSGGLFGSTQPKPGGLFGSTGTTGFGAGTTGFGAPGTSFGTGTSAFGAGGTGLNFGGTSGTMMGQPQQASQSAGTIQQQIISLATSPYGDNPLFKNLMQDSGKREEILKPTNPAAQKALNSSQYKVSPHRNIKVKAKPIIGSGSGNKSAIFDGLEDDDINPKSELFVPRSSVKKLVLKSRSPNNSKRGSETTDDIDQSLTVPLSARKAEDSLILNPVKELPSAKVPDVVDESFSAYNIRKKPLPDHGDNPVSPTHDESSIIQNISQNDSDSAGSENGDDNNENHPARVTLKRSGYYTIPPLSELAGMVDENGNCNVEGFTIGRTGYGNIYFPGVVNVAGMNFDEIVFFRHKEVIVYPDDNNKPELGDGLNRKAQITLDKVWPVDKTKKEPIKSPEKLSAMSYEDRLEKACLKLGAKFMEYRPETGSWVFKVDHFSKYGLEDSDEEELPATKQKKLKTLQLERREPARPTLPPRPDPTVTTVTVHNAEDKMAAGDTSVTVEIAEESTSPPAEQLNRINAQGRKVQLMKASLFDEEEEMDVQPTVTKPRPVILEARNTTLERRDKFIEDIAHSMLTGSSSRGLGGSFTMSAEPPSLTSSLLRSQFLSQSSYLDASIRMEKNAAQTPKKALPIYSLQGGYEKFVSLPSGGPSEKRRTVVPQHVDRILPLQESLIGKKLRCLADNGLTMSRRFRIGWSKNWVVTNTGDSLDEGFMGEKHATDVNIERVQVQKAVLEDEQAKSLEEWFDKHLEHSVCIMEDDSPKFQAEEGLPTLHAHAAEAKRQVAEEKSASEKFGPELKQVREVWDLCLALWGELEDDLSSHEVAMQRRDAVSKWLEEAVGSKVKESLNKALVNGNKVDEVLAMLSGNNLDAACDKAQDNGDHYSALLMSQSGGNNSVPGQLLFQQMDRWQEVHADTMVAPNRLNLYSLIAGNAIWPGSDDSIVNTCDGLDWKRAFAIHIWFLTSPMASVADALMAFDSAFMGRSEFGAYAAAPKPHYAEHDHEEVDSKAMDIKYHLLKLYSERSHSMERILCPVTHTPNYLDHRLSWFVGQVLQSLGYHHMSEHGQDDLHASFAAQLESYGLWQWAVFVLLHLSDRNHRQSMVKSVLERHIKLNNDDSMERENFLQDQLNVPLAWIADVKATLAATEKNYNDQAWYLIKAQEWNKAHEVIVKKIAPDAIINDNYDFFFNLLSELANPEVSVQISGWDLAGQIFFDFINVDMEVRELLAKRDEEAVGYYIERLKPKVTDLCKKISSLTVHTAKERLCQSEIAKKVAHLMRAVLEMDSAKQPKASRILAQHLSMLPLPDDYELQELRSLTMSYMMEIMES